MLSPRARLVAVVAVVAVAVLCALVAALAQAAGPTRVFRLAQYVEFDPPRLGLDARGDAVVSWLQSADVVGRERGASASAIFASVRRAGGGFQKARRISGTDRGVRSYALAVGARGHGPANAHLRR